MIRALHGSASTMPVTSMAAASSASPAIRASSAGSTWARMAAESCMESRGTELGSVVAAEVAGGAALQADVGDGERQAASGLKSEGGPYTAHVLPGGGEAGEGNIEVLPLPVRRGAQRRCDGNGAAARGATGHSERDRGARRVVHPIVETESHLSVGLAAEVDGGCSSDFRGRLAGARPAQQAGVFLLRLVDCDEIQASAVG